jgi:AAHS family 4-hydroxybenzoate transporter-like MFS transporter
MELGVGRVGAILGPFVAGALQQSYQSSLPMFVAIGLAALAAGGIILFANRASAKAGVESEVTDARRRPVPAEVHG